MADYAIHDTTLYDIADVIRKKDGSSALIDPADYAGRVNLMGPLEEKTVSGSIVAFSDGADDVPLKSCAVTIAPTLDGVSSVDMAKEGYNLLDISTVIVGNLNINTGNVDTSSQSWKTSAFIPCREGDFTLSWESPQSTFYQGKWVAYDKNKTRLDGESATAYNTYSKTFTFPSGTAFVRVGWAIVASGNPAPKENVRLNAGNSDLGYTEYVQPTTHTANLGRTIYGGSVDVVNGTGMDENGNDFTFAAVSIISRLGDNTMWSEDGDLSVVYRSSGTQTLIPPTLISKTVTENGTYSAEDDNADGYDEVTVNVSGGGGGNTPEATQTLICDNSSLGSTLTFTDDYENYDLIKFVVYRSDVQNTFVFYATPTMINACCQYSSNRINFNQPYGNNFVCYTRTSNTSWSRYGVRNMAVQYVYGLTFTNCTVAETELYNRQGIGSSAVTFTPPTGESFLDYDYILFMTCTGNSDETQVNLEVFQPGIEKDIFGSTNVKEDTVTVYRYNTGGTTATVTENTITSYQYFYACGLKVNFNQQNLLGGSLNSSNSEELNEELNSEEEENENELGG